MKKRILNCRLSEMNEYALYQLTEKEGYEIIDVKDVNKELYEALEANGTMSDIKSISEMIINTGRNFEMILLPENMSHGLLITLGYMLGQTNQAEFDKYNF